MDKKETEKLREYLKTKNVLLITESSTDRTSWKRLFADLGVPVGNIENGKTKQEALDHIEQDTVDIIFASYIFHDEPIYDILDAHILKYPNRAEVQFYVVSGVNSLTAASDAAEREIDGFLIKPYNKTL